MATCTYNCFMNVINIGNSIIGVSILAMPYCFRKCGILLSIVLIIISGLLTKLACFLLLKSAVMARRRSFEFLAFNTFGTYGKLVVEMSVIGFLIGVCIAFFVVIGDLGPPLAAEVLSIKNTPNLRTNVLMLVGLCVALPLGLLRKIDSLASLSALSIAFYVCLILKIFAEAVPNLAENEWWYSVNWWRSEGILPCLPIFSMALSCQTQLFEFFDTSVDPALKRMQSVISGAVYLCSAVYILVGIFGYIAFHDKNITGNILVLLTPSVITEFIKLGFILTVAVSFPLCLFPCRSSLHSLLFKQGIVHHDLNVNIIPDHRFRILTLSLVMVTIGIAIMLPSIEFVLGIIGSTIGTLICLILPAVIFIYDSNKMTTEKRKAQMLLSIGTFILVACTFSTLNENQAAPEKRIIEIEQALKITPVPLPIINSIIPKVIEQPRVDPVPVVILKEKPKDDKVEVSNDQKRLEPPVPQEPEIKVEQNQDLDPQALQKEDKEILKDNSQPLANSVGLSKKDEGLEKQEKLLEKLEEQHKKQKEIIDEQKKILEELKMHQESHEEMRKNELSSRQEKKKMDAAVDVPKENVAKLESNQENLQTKQKEDITAPKQVEVKLTQVVENKENPVKAENLSKPLLNVNEVPDDIQQRHVDSNIKVSLKRGGIKNVTLEDKKSRMINLNQTINDLKENSKAPSSPSILIKDVPKIKETENLINSNLHVKHRETLGKKQDAEVTDSLPPIVLNSVLPIDKQN